MTKPSLLFALALASLPTFQVTPWAGTWRLDRHASRFRGELIKIDATPTGYRFNLGAVRFTLPDDGAFHPTVAGRETSLRRLGEGRWERTHRINGRIVDHSTLTLEEGGRVLAIAGEHPGAVAERLVRQGAGHGLAGLWRSASPGIDAPRSLQISAIGDGRLRWGSPEQGNGYDVRIGGPQAINAGPTASPSATLQMAAMPDRSLHWVERVDGRPSREGVDRLSPDGRVLTETAWPAGSPGERQTLVYERSAGP